MINTPPILLINWWKVFLYFIFFSSIILILLSLNKAPAFRISLVGWSQTRTEGTGIFIPKEAGCDDDIRNKICLGFSCVCLDPITTWNITQIIKSTITYDLVQSYGVIHLPKRTNWLALSNVSCARKLRIVHIWSSSARREEFPRMHWSLPKKYRVVSLFDKCTALTAAPLHSPVCCSTGF